MARTRATARKSIRPLSTSQIFTTGTPPTIDNSAAVTSTTTSILKKNCNESEGTPTKMKTLGDQTEKVGVASESMVLVAGEVTLDKRKENAGTESPGSNRRKIRTSAPAIKSEIPTINASPKFTTKTPPSIGNSAAVTSISTAATTTTTFTACNVKEETSTKMKAPEDQTEKVGIESGSTVLAADEVTVAEKTDNAGTESPGSGEHVSDSGSKAAMKKKVRIVKKIVKKKVIKKVAKRVSVSSDCNESEKVEASDDGETANPSSCPCVAGENFNPSVNVPMEIESSVPVEVEKHSTGVDDLRKGEDLEGFEVSEREKGVYLEENGSTAPEVAVGVDLCGDEGRMGGLVAVDRWEDQNLIEDVSGQCDDKYEDVEGDEGDGAMKELRETSECMKMDIGLDNGVEGEEGMREHGEKSECFVSKINVESSEHVEGEVGVKGQVEGTEGVGLKLNAPSSAAVDSEEGVTELKENTEVGGLRVEQGSGAGILFSGETEILEREKMQRTEIFIGGLDKETMEEDVKKVFEEVGEVIEVRLVTDGKTGKHRGFGFIRYTSAADAKMALKKYHHVEICGRQCGTAAVEGNDAIYLGNIDKKWKKENVLVVLQEIGIEKIDKVSIVADPENTELNRGFAFLEFVTKEDAQMAYDKLQKESVFGKHLKIKVAWAEPLVEPGKEDMPNIKSVYAEQIPSSWDEVNVRDYFDIFGEIESIALAKNLRSTKRNDFAFINYMSRESALSCIRALTHEQQTDSSSKVQVKVSLAKTVPKGRRNAPISKPVNELYNVKQGSNQAGFRSQFPRNIRTSGIGRHEIARADGGSSTTAELLQLLREQASWKQATPGSTIAAGSCQPEYLHPLTGGKRSFAQLADHVVGNEAFHHDPIARPRLPPPLFRNGLISSGVAITSFPRHIQERANYRTGPFSGAETNPGYFQTRDQVPYNGSHSVYRRMP